MADSTVRRAQHEHLETDTLMRARKAASAFRAAARVMGVLQQLLPGDVELIKLAAVCRELEGRFTRLTMIDRGQRAFEDALEPIENAVHRFAKELAAAEGEIPMEWFRAHFNSAIATSEAVADYAALIGRFASEDPSRLDRVQFLLTRVIRDHLGGAGRVGGQLQRLLEEVLPPAPLDAAQRAGVVQFFRDAARRATEFTSLDKMMSSGFFVDTRGYKLSLRRNILDPEVMSAVIELNEVTSATIERLTASEASAFAARPAGNELKDHLAQVDQRLKDVFKSLRSEDAERAARFQRRLARTAKLKGGALAFDAAGSRWTRARPIALAVAICVGLVVLLAQTSRGSRLTEMNAADAKQLSPYLSKAGVAPAGRPTVLIGEVDKTRWALMNPAQRRDAATKLSTAIRQRGLRSATVLLEGRVVIQVEDGQILIVQ